MDGYHYIVPRRYPIPQPHEGGGETAAQAIAYHGALIDFLADNNYGARLRQVIGPSLEAQVAPTAIASLPVHTGNIG
jgi:hypothetical protein